MNGSWAVGVKPHGFVGICSLSGSLRSDVVVAAFLVTDRKPLFSRMSITKRSLSVKDNSVVAAVGIENKAGNEIVARGAVRDVHKSINM